MGSSGIFTASFGGVISSVTRESVLLGGVGGDDILCLGEVSSLAMGSDFFVTGESDGVGMVGLLLFGVAALLLAIACCNCSNFKP